MIQKIWFPLQLGTCMALLEKEKNEKDRIVTRLVSRHQSGGFGCQRVLKAQSNSSAHICIVPYTWTLLLGKLKGRDNCEVQ